jgi:uncharacterized protein YecT (DUF1311 family)
MKKFLYCILVLTVVMFAIPAFAAAEEENNHLIDIEFQERLDSDPSTAGMIEASEWAEKEWDNLLNANYRELMKYLSKEEQTKLKASQHKWLEYRDLEFAFSAEFWSNFDGTMYRAFAPGDRMEFVKARALKLGEYLANREE